MRPRIATAALLFLIALAVPAHAELDASGTRLSIAGSAPRFYMTYGHIADTELYAPVIPQLRRVGVAFERAGDDYIVYVRNVKKATWAIVRSRDEVPETGVPCVLELGGATYVPLKAIGEMARLQVSYSKTLNQVALYAGPDTRPAAPLPQARVDPGAVTLAGVQVEQKGATLELRIRTSGAVRPRAVRVGSDNIPRLCLDFRGAKWADRLALPAPMGDLRAIRIGYPPDTGDARLTVEVPSKDFNITGVSVEKDEVVAILSRGILARTARISPEAAAELRIREAVGRRSDNRMASGRLEDRSVDGPLVDPVTGEPLENGTIIRPGRGPEIDIPGRFNPVGNLSGRSIVVDAGHGGKHAGAKGLYNLEKDLCLKMALDLQRALERRGANVTMTRTSDVFVHLDTRCQIANQSGADIFISIHCNSMPRRNMQSGTETYWHSSAGSRRLARALHPRIVGTVSGRDGGIRNRSFQVIRETHMPSVLLEIAYINNTQDELLLSDDGFHNRLAENIARGVLDYFGTDAE